MVDKGDSLAKAGAVREQRSSGTLGFLPSPPGLSTARVKAQRTTVAAPVEDPGCPDEAPTLKTVFDVPLVHEHMPTEELESETTEVSAVAKSALMEAVPIAPKPKPKPSLARKVPNPSRTSSIAQRIGRSKPKSAADILKDFGASTKQTKASIHRRATTTTAPANPAPVKKAPETKNRVMSGRDDVVNWLSKAMPEATVVQVLSITNADVFAALWASHRARANLEGNYSLAATAQMLLDIVETQGMEALLGVEVRIGDRQFAGWYDRSGCRLVALIEPMTVYLAGLT